MSRIFLIEGKRYQVTEKQYKKIVNQDINLSLTDSRDFVRKIAKLLLKKEKV